MAALMGKVAILIVVLTIFLRGASLAGLPAHPDVGLNVLELAKSHGYPIETHEVETQDGYLLVMHRIPHGKRGNEAGSRRKSVVFLMHGLLSCSADWLNVGPERSLAYKLVDLGYDVWMGNARGNAESRRHRHLNPDVDSKEFWAFSWHEIGAFDLPAMIDYTLSHTGQQQLQYVGFSQGGTGLLVMGSMRPEYNAKIKFAALLAPAAEMSHIKNPFLRLLVPHVETLYQIANALGVHEVFPRTGSFERLGMELCSNGKGTQELCKLLFFFIAGYNREQLDGGFIPVITTSTPAGSSVRQLVHFFQSMRGAFKQFDFYNETLNIAAYGSRTPPRYDLSRVTAPIAIFYGLNDWLVSDVDGRLTASQLPNVVHLKAIEHPAWCHLDFAWATDIAEFVYDNVIQLITDYAN